MDCQQAQSLFEVRADGQTLTSPQELRLAEHIESCEICAQATRPDEDADWKWVAKLPSGSLDDGGIALPTVDRSVYETSGSIARGGMGRIVKAYDRRLKRTIAVKEVLSPAYRPRFEREALITARLQHPAIVPIYEAGEWPDGSAFYTMRLIPGATLADAISAATNLEERLALASHLVAVTDALAYAHSERVIHRDLKPLNVLVGEFGETVVIDWGLARMLDDDDDAGGESADAIHGDLTQAGAVLGTPAYMSPEQASGGDVDKRSDVYALGAMLYTLLVGKAPYKDTHSGVIAGVLIDAVVKGPPTPIRELEPQAPAELVAIAERAMQGEPGDRFQDAGEMAAELRRFAAGQLIASHQYTLRELLGRWLRKHRTAVVVAAVAAIVLAVGGALSVNSIVASRADERDARRAADRALVEAEARNHQLIFEQARTAVSRDPTSTVVSLLDYPESGPARAAAALLALEAERLGVAAQIFTRPTYELGRLAFVKNNLLLASSTLTPSRAFTLDTGEQRELDSFDRAEAFFDPLEDRFLSPAFHHKYEIVFEAASGPRKTTRKSLPPGTSEFSDFEFAYDPLSRTAVYEVVDQNKLGVWRAGSDNVEMIAVPGRPVAIVKAGARVLVESEDKTRLIDLASGAELATFDTEYALTAPPWAGFAVRGPVAFAACLRGGRGRVRAGLGVWNEGSAAAKRFDVDRECAAVAIDPAGERFAATFKDGTVRLGQLSEPESSCSFDVAGEPTAVALSSDLVAVGTASGDVLLTSSCENKTERLRGHIEPVVALAITSDSATIATTASDEELRIYHRTPAAPRIKPSPIKLSGCDEVDRVFERGGWTWVHCGEPEAYWVGRHPRGGAHRADISFAARISGDGTTLISVYSDKTPVFRRGRELTVDVKTPLGANPSADGSMLYVPQKSDKLQIWSVEDNALSSTLDVVAKAVFPSPDGEVLLIETERGFRVTDLAGELIAEHEGELASIRARWSDDGSLVAAHATDRALLVYDRGELSWNKLTAFSEISDFAVSASGTYAAAVADDRLVLWHIATGISADVGGVEGDGDVHFSGDHTVRYQADDNLFEVAIPTFRHQHLRSLTSAVRRGDRLRSPVRVVR